MPVKPDTACSLGRGAGRVEFMFGQRPVGVHSKICVYLDNRVNSGFSVS